MGIMTKIIVGLGLDNDKDQAIGTPKIAVQHSPQHDFNDPLKALKDSIIQALKQLQEGEVKQYRRIAEDEYYYIESLQISTPYVETRQVLEKTFFRHDMPKRLNWLKKECLSLCTKEKGVLLDKINHFGLVVLDGQEVDTQTPLSPKAQLLAQNSSVLLEVLIEGNYETLMANTPDKPAPVITPTPNNAPNNQPQTRIILNQEALLTITLCNGHAEQKIELNQDYGELRRGEIIEKNPEKIKLTGDLISGHHADFRVHQQTLFVTDYSSNGTYYQQQRLEKNQPIALNLPCEIRLGARLDNARESLENAPILKFALPESTKTRIAEPAKTRLAAPAGTRVVLLEAEPKPTLLLRLGSPNEWQTLELTENTPYLFGRGEESALKFKNEAANVSRKHLGLKWLGGNQIEVTDFSSNGVFHAQGRLTRDDLQILELPLRLRLGAATDRGDMSFNDAPCVEIDALSSVEKPEMVARRTQPTPTKITLPEV